MAKSTATATKPVEKKRRAPTEAEIVGAVSKLILENELTKEEICDKVGEELGRTSSTIQQNYKAIQKSWKEKHGASLPDFPSSRGRKEGDEDEVAALVAKFKSAS